MQQRIYQKTHAYIQTKCCELAKAGKQIEEIRVNLRLQRNYPQNPEDPPNKPTQRQNPYITEEESLSGPRVIKLLFVVKIREPTRRNPVVIAMD